MTSGSIDALVDTLSLEEQVALLAGANFWETVAVERAGIPSIRVSDGPVGARGTRFDGPASINVPCGTSLAATWDPSLAERIGALLGRETRAKGAARAHGQLAPHADRWPQLRVHERGPVSHGPDGRRLRHRRPIRRRRLVHQALRG